MEWVFVTAVFVLFVYHRTVRRVVVALALLACLGVGGLFYVGSAPSTDRAHLEFRLQALRDAKALHQAEEQRHITARLAEIRARTMMQP